VRFLKKKKKKEHIQAFTFNLFYRFTSRHYKRWIYTSHVKMWYHYARSSDRRTQNQTLQR